MAILRRQKDKIAYLAKVDLFRALKPGDLMAVAKRADEVTAEAGDVLCEQGTLGTEFFLIVSGSAAVRRNKRRIATLVRGDFFGEMALIEGHARSASVVALEDCVLLVMHRKDFSGLLDDSPAITRRLLQGMSARLREADRKLVV